MLPFNNTGHSNYIPDPYSHAGYFTSQLYFIPEQAALLYKPPVENENQEFPFQAVFGANFPHLFEECPVEVEQRETKASQVKENQDNQSSVSANNLDESSQHSPQLRFKQKYGRNINSNIFHHMVRKLLVDKNFEEIVKKIIAREKTKLTESEFMEFLARKEQKLPTYVSFQKMKKMLQGQKYRNRIYQETLIKQGQFCKIFRIVCRYYLKIVHPLHVYSFLRIKAQSRRLQIIGSRRILQQMNPK